MQLLRHKKLTSKQGAARGGSNETGFSDDGNQSNKSKGTHGVQTRRSKGPHSVQSNSSKGPEDVQSNRSKGAAGSSKRSIADGAKFKRVTRSKASHTESSGRSSAGGVNSTMVADGGVNSTMVRADCEQFERNSDNGASHGVNTQLNGASSGINSQLNGASSGINSQLNGASGGVNSQLNGASDGVNSQLNGASDGVNSHLNGGSDGVNSQLNDASDGGNSHMNIRSKRVRGDAPKKGRAKMSRTELKMAPRSGRVELAPKGHHQFKYVSYNPKGLKYPSQVGAILKREYPGIIKVYDEQGNVVKQHPAKTWNDYYWKKNRDGICYARRVKQEFWKLFTVHPRHRVAADKILEAYLVRRVTNMVYQLRLEAVKMYFHKKGETCDDTRARIIELTEEQYLTCRLEWCSKASWAWFCKYWTSDDYKRKREIAQDCCMRSEDNAQNRAGSRNFSETQQFLEHTFGRDQSGTLNTYAVMKSGFKNVDSTGRAGPIRSQKAQKRLDDYRELVSDENSQELDGKALHIVGNGMKHGRVPIGDGAVDKEIVLIHSKSVGFKPVNPADYDKVIKENDQLKETNGMLFEENRVNRELIMAMYSEFGREPPAELMRRLESIDVRRQQNVGSPHGGSHSVDDRRNAENIDERDDGNNSNEDDEDGDGGDGDGEDGDDSDSEGNGDGGTDQESDEEEHDR